LAKVAVALVLAAAYLYVLEHKVNWRSAGRAGENEIAWQPWSPAAVAAARAEGRPILVDFTASWCLTCQVNKETSIEIPSVIKRLKEIKAVALIEDSRVKNAAVVAEMRRHGRGGVPLVLVYPRQADKPPIVLPEVLTPSLVLDALDKANAAP
jgi:thiol:disulfide interchange protein DsbD